MGRKKTQKRNSFLGLGLCFIAVALVVLILSFLMLRPAQGTGGASETIGVGQAQRTQVHTDALPAVDKLGTEVIDQSDFINDKTTSNSASLSEASQRSIVVKDPDPVIAYAAVDMSNPTTVALAEQYGCINPLPTAPRLLPDVTGAGWSLTMASAYDLENNDGWDATASGVTLTRNSVTAAVPASQSYLLGRTVEIVYGDTVVMATITDTGGFEQYGRGLDLAPGVWKAFGGASCENWGVRPVYYRFL